VTTLNGEFKDNLDASTSWSADNNGGEVTPLNTRETVAPVSLTCCEKCVNTFCLSRTITSDLPKEVALYGSVPAQSVNPDGSVGRAPFDIQAAALSAAR
jgi:hypothetical protein